MSYRLWPAALVSGAALAAACVVVGDHVAQTSGGCLGSAGFFTATPVSWPIEATAADDKGKTAPYKLGVTRPTGIDEIGPASVDPNVDDHRISGCLDVERIEIPQAPAPDGRA